MRAVILAAGRGTRMGPLTASSPKPLLELRGRPIIGHILSGLGAAGVGQVVIVTGYLGEQIERALGDGSDYGVSLTYRRQDRSEGTARALLTARAVLEAGPFILSWGDVVVGPATYRSLCARFEQGRPDVLLAVNEVDDPWAGAAVHVDRHWRVERIVEKPPRGTSATRWNNAGIFVFQPLIFEYAERLRPSPRNEYELPQAIAAMVGDGRRVEALPVEGFWSDVGTPADLQAAEEELARLPPE